MFITITIQTFNHSDYLRATLESLLAIRCPEGADYEILVVDNNSSDQTPVIIEEYTKILAPRLRSVFEERQGLSFARNRALEEAHGEIVCFIDDDVMVDAGWLEAVTEAFRKYGAAVVGGRSYLIYTTQRPVWLGAENEVMLSKLDYGDEAEVGTQKELFGLNFSVTKQMAVEAGGFDTNYGRRGGTLLCGEEIALLSRIRKNGGLAVYEPRAVVGHVVPTERLTKKWFFRRIYYGAISMERHAISQGHQADLGKLITGTVRCCGGVAKSLLLGNISEKDFFMKEYYAIANFGRLIERLRHKLQPIEPA